MDLHDECAVLIAVLIEGVQLGYRIIKRLKRERLQFGEDGGGGDLFSQLACLVRAVENLVVEN